MKNVKTIVDLPWLVRSLTVCWVIFVYSITASAYKSAPDFPDVKKYPSKDSAILDKIGFKSLFSGSYYNPSLPYASQLNPRAIPFVENYIRTNGEYLQKMKVWGKPYFDMYDGILVQHGIPRELKYLSVIESSLIPNVVSFAGAVGPWQIMADEARRMGLRVNNKIDERVNFYKSTYAAARILRELHAQFKDWLLVIAAYNCGAGRVRQAINRSGSKDFWNLQAYLPEETRNHVKRFIGTHYIFEGSGGLTTMTASEISNFDLNSNSANNINNSALGSETDIVEISGKYKSNIIARNLALELSAFNKLNPNFDRLVGGGNSYKMRLPKDKVDLFKSNKHIILNESIEAFLNYR